MADLAAISENVQKGQAKRVEQLVQQALDEGFDVAEVLENGLIAGMAVIGEKFKKNEVYVPEVLIAARAMKAGMKILEPELASAGVKPYGIAAIGTVKGDLHDIGKNLVSMMLQGAGFKVMDLGIDQTPASFIKAAKEGAQVLCLSALLTTTMPQMAEVVKARNEAGLKVPILIGGAPVTQSYCDEIKADGYAPDAASAVDVAKKLIGKA